MEDSIEDSIVVIAVRRVFEADGIWSDVDQSKSMFLLVPHMLAHIVLKDAAKYEATMDALRRIEVQFRAQNERFEWGLRSSWKIDHVEFIAPYYIEDGTICAASEIRVQMISGSRIVLLRVAFTHQAGEDLERATKSAPNDYEAHKREEVEKTRRFVELLLARGGEMAWDPLWPGNDKLKINSIALEWILQEEQQRLAVD